MIQQTPFQDESNSKDLLSENLNDSTMELLQQRKEYYFKKNGSETAICLLLNLAFAFIISYLVFSFVPLVFFFIKSAEISEKLVESLTTQGGMLVISLVGMVVANVVPAIFCAKKTGVSIKGLFKKGKFNKGLFVSAFILLFAAQFVGQIIYAVIDGLLNQIGFRAEPFSLQMPADTFGMIMYIVLICIAAPITEEFLFRGVILNTLLPYGTVFASLISSLFFGLLHGNFQQMPFALLIGFVLSYVVIKTGTIRYAILLHMINNTYAVVMELLLMLNAHNPEFENWLSLYMMIFSFLCIIIGIIILMIYRYQLHSSNGEDRRQTKPYIQIDSPYAKYFSLKSVIILLIVTIFGMVSSIMGIAS